MKDNKSPWVDGIAPKILKETMEQISMPLAHVFNMSLQEGIVPLEWKEANIIPLFKKRFKKQVPKLSTSQFDIKNLQSIRKYNNIRDHNYGLLSQQFLVNKPFSSWVLKRKIEEMSSDTHQFQLIKLHYFKLERFKSI